MINFYGILFLLLKIYDTLRIGKSNTFGSKVFESLVAASDFLNTLVFNVLTFVIHFVKLNSILLSTLFPLPATVSIAPSTSTFR